MKSFKEFIVESPEDEIATNLARSRDAHNAEYPDGDKHGDAVYAKYKADKAAKAAGAPSKDPHGDAAMAKSRAGTTVKPIPTDPNMDPDEAAHQKKMAGHKANIDRIRSARENEKTSDQIGAMNPNEREKYKRQLDYDLKAAQDRLVGVRATNKVNLGVANAVADVKQGLNNADIARRRAEQAVSGAKWDAQVDSLRNKVNDNILRADTAIKNVQSAQSSPRSDIDGSGRPDPNKPRTPRDPNKPMPSLISTKPKTPRDGFIDGRGIYVPNKPRTPRDRSKDRALLLSLVTMNPSYELIPGGRRRIQRPDAPARVEDNWMRDYIRGQGKKKYETPKTPNKPMPGDGSTSIKPRNPRNPNEPTDMNAKIKKLPLINPRGILKPEERYPMPGNGSTSIKPLTARDPNSPIPRFGRKQSDNPINTKMSERIRKNIINRPRQ